MMESRFISTPSGKFHAMVAGSGVPTLLLHGYSTEVNSWRTWEKNIDALSEKCRVYALDLLGYGESDKPEPRLDARRQARAIVELLDAEKIERANLIGLSWGGMVAQIIVGQSPERVNKLVLVDSGYDDSPKGQARLAKIQCPTLIVWDENDLVIPVPGAEYLARSIPSARLRVLEQSERDPGADPANRHWSQVSHSREWNRAVGEFLGEENSV